jgi:hypothetical protein
MINLEEAFEKIWMRDPMPSFNQVRNKLHPRPDMCAFLYLDRLLPPDPADGSGIVQSAEHDEIFLNVDCDALAEIATPEDILYLACCGVMYNAGYNCLSMFR